MSYICLNCGFVGPDAEKCARCEEHGWDSSHVVSMDRPPREHEGMFTWDARRGVKDRGLKLAGFARSPNRGEEPPSLRVRRLGGRDVRAADRIRK